jgi:1-acyl-sn-glycerol-3-phosphate acyltransferase
MSNIKKAGLWFATVRWFCWLFCKVFLKFKAYDTHNVPPSEGFLLVCNHQSFLDPLFCTIGIKRELTFMARDTLFEKRFFGGLIKSVNAIPVRRGQGEPRVMKEIIRRLKAQQGVCLYPEATRTIDGKISAFKGGFGLLSRRANAAIIPVVIEGGFECWPRDRKLFKIGSQVRVRFGHSISPEQVTNMKNDELAAMMTNLLRKMQNQLRLEMGKEPIEYPGN